MSLQVSITGSETPYRVHFGFYGSPEAVAGQRLEAVRVLATMGIENFTVSARHPGFIDAHVDDLAVKGIIAGVDPQVLSDNRRSLFLKNMIDTAVS